MRKYSEGRYERDEDIVHVWYPKPIALDSEPFIDEFFRETLEEWIEPCPRPPHLLVGYQNVTLRADMTDAYARNIGRFRGRILGTYRYGIAPDALGHFTAVAVRLGNMKLAAPVNIFATERDARTAIAKAKGR